MIIVSDRGPRTLTADGRVIERGGSVTRLLARQLGAVEEPVSWVAPTTDPLDRWPDRLPELARCPDAPSASYVPVQIPPETHDGYYLLAGARMLWMALHGLDVPAGSTPAAERAAFDDYAAVNEAVADAVAARARPDEPVLVQDYQLALVPGMLRAGGFPGPVSFFLHTAFDSRSFEHLGTHLASQWLSSLYAADVLWFQARRWQEEFQRAVRRLPRGTVPARPPATRIRPVTLSRADAAALRARVPRTEPPHLDWADERVNVLFVGRLDPAKNVERCVLAFEELLRERPRLAGTARLTLLLVPSRQSLPEYAHYARRVADHCERIQRHHPGSLRVVPGDDQDRALWAMTRADVVIANSVRDGSNLVVQEALRLTERDCQLVVSSGLGVAELLGDGARVIADPLSVAETRAALGTAIDAAAAAGPPAGPTPPSRRLSAACEALDRCDPDNWLASQLERLPPVPIATRRSNARRPVDTR